MNVTPHITDWDWEPPHCPICWVTNSLYSDTHSRRLSGKTKRYADPEGFFLIWISTQTKANKDQEKNHFHQGPMDSRDSTVNVVKNSENVV